MFKAICAGFNATPSTCFEEEYKNAPGKISLSAVLLILALAVAINVVIVCLCRRCTRREMKDDIQMQISSIMGQYLALNENSMKVPTANVAP